MKKAEREQLAKKADKYKPGDARVRTIVRHHHFVCVIVGQYHVKSGRRWLLLAKYLPFDLSSDGYRLREVIFQDKQLIEMFEDCDNISLDDWDQRLELVVKLGGPRQLLQGMVEEYRTKQKRKEVNARRAVEKVASRLNAIEDFDDAWKVEEETE